MIAAGQTIGSYRILQKIGTGGMGAVYLAEHPLIGKKVALKVIHKELATNKEVVQRFFQEAKAVTKIGNEHIIQIHDFGVTPDGDHFYIMDYLDGQTLAQIIAKDTVLPTMRALHIGAQIAAALSAAHSAGVIHRDLKPDNVMLTQRLGDSDFVVLLDFGLAKMNIGGSSAVKTAAGVLLGTPQYMSPEACESRGNLDHRTDIYALGILLFQMITGMLPFDGETMGEVLVKQVTQLPPPPRGFNPSIPPSVEQIVLRCLAKNPDARFPTMISLREALLDPEQYLRASPPMSPARSLAPGEVKVDAKTIMAYAAQEQQQRTQIGTGSAPLPLPAPPTTLPGNAGAKTMMADGNLVPPRPVQAPPPEMVVPNQPKMNTMRIATPHGYSSRPPRKMWPIVLVLALLLGLGGGAFAVAYFGNSSGTGGGSGGDSGSAVAGGSSGSTGSGPGSAVAVTPIDAAAVAVVAVDAAAPVAAIDAAAAPVVVDAAAAVHVPSGPTAVISIESTPSGAEVFGPDGKSVGKTPVKVTLPISDLPLEFELKLAGYKKKKKSIVVTGNSIVDVPLDRAPSGNSGGNRNKGSGAGNDNGLMNPDDL
ncbi:MAG TPA: serine/threonine-protein kinase [Kofleriaceae bacterium]|nr:serine/threonine-protein kinase [Kofleriaceae bacterium]